MHEAPTARQIPVSPVYLANRPQLALTRDELHATELTPREYFVVSLCDGATPIDSLLDLTGLPAEDTLALVEALVKLGVLTLEE